MSGFVVDLDEPRTKPTLAAPKQSSRELAELFAAAPNPYRALAIFFNDRRQRRLLTPEMERRP